MLRVARVVPCSDVSGVILPWRQLLSSSVRNADGALHMTKGLKAAEPWQKGLLRCCLIVFFRADCWFGKEF